MLRATWRGLETWCGRDLGPPARQPSTLPMSGMWKRSHARPAKAPPDERGGNGYVLPRATAPHLNSARSRRFNVPPATSALPRTTNIVRVARHVSNVPFSEVIRIRDAAKTTIVRSIDIGSTIFPVPKSRHCSQCKIKSPELSERCSSAQMAECFSACVHPQKNSGRAIGIQSADAWRMARVSMWRFFVKFKKKLV